MYIGIYFYIRGCIRLKGNQWFLPQCFEDMEPRYGQNMRKE